MLLKWNAEKEFFENGLEISCNEKSFKKKSCYEKTVIAFFFFFEEVKMNYITTTKEPLAQGVPEEKQLCQNNIYSH